MYEISKKSLFFKLLIILDVVLLYYYIKYGAIMSSGISSNNRIERFTVGNLFSSGIEIMIYNYAITSFVIATTIILAYMIIYGKLKKISFILLALSIFLYAGIGSGRGPVIDVLIAMVLIFFIRKIDSEKRMGTTNDLKKIYKTKKVKLWNLIFIVLMVVIIFGYSAWLTASRMGYTELSMVTIQIGLNEFLKDLVVYCTGPFRALDFGLQVYTERVGYLFGRGTFAGIDEIIFRVFRIMNINFTPANTIIGELLQSNTIRIGSHQYFNFAYTSVMIHYFDLGTLGVIIFPFLYGFFMRKAIFLYEKKPVLPTLIILVLLFNTMINSVFKWGLQSPAPIIALLCCYFWSKHRSFTKENEITLDTNYRISKREL